MAVQQRTVWILGAGASKAAYCGMPLTGEFMREALRRIPFSRNRIRGLLKTLDERYRYKDPTDVDVEELLTFAAYDVDYLDRQGAPVLKDDALSRQLYHARDTLLTVEKLITGVLFGAQRECLQSGDRIHDYIVKKVGDNDTVVSFNYDLLVDRALWTAKRASSDDYDVQFRGSVDAAMGSSDIEQYRRQPQGETGCVPILKLHGSLSWLCPVDRAQSEASETGHSIFFLPNATDVSMDPDILWNRFRGLRPFIVPPTFMKETNRSPLPKLWRRAHAALQACHRVVIIGHSLREADCQTRWLLRTAARGERKARWNYRCKQ